MSRTPIADALEANINDNMEELRGGAEAMDVATFFAKSLGNVIAAVRTLEETVKEGLTE